ncbi:MAG: transketolase family protein [Candidatus Thorarchaeota archaeon]
MTELSLRDVFGDLLTKNGEIEQNIVVLDADLSSSTRTNKFSIKFPNRFFNMGIAEQNMLGTAIGLAISGKIPIVSGFSIFTTGRAWEFIRIACHDKLNVKIISTHAGFVGEDGSTHNALEDLSLMTSLSNLNVLVPADSKELIEIFNYLLEINGPFYVRLPRGVFPKIHDEHYKFKFGQPDVLKEGKDIGLIGTGFGTILALQSVDSVERELNCSIKIINMPTIKPINESKLINEIKNLKGMVIIEEHNVYCGFGSILARIISKYMPLDLQFIGINESFGESGKRETLLDTYGMNIQKVKESVSSLLKI